jgi:hypothetical protein
MEDLFSETSLEVSDLHSRKMISCRRVWTIFPKGILVYSRVKGHDRIYQVIDIHSAMLTDRRATASAKWIIRCRYVLFDGNFFGMATTALIIPAFNGIRKISSLPVYPLGFHTDSSLEHRLRERGERILGFQDTAYRDYNGTGVATVDRSEDDVYEEYEEDNERERVRRHSGGKSYHVSEIVT